MSGYSDAVMANVGTSGNPGSGNTTDSTIDYPVIDNTTYAYSVSLGAIDGIITYGIVIEYTTTSVY